MGGDGKGQRRRGGGRSARRALRAEVDHNMLPGLTNRLPFTEPMDRDQVLRTNAASMAILEEVGVVFRDPVALQNWRCAGADVRGERVHLDRGLVRELVATIPSDISYIARNPENSVAIGGNRAVFVPITGAPYLRDLDDLRRMPTLADLAMFHKLAHMRPALHSVAHHTVEPCDLAVSHRHLHIT